jgi:hypothetical protein
MIPVITYALNGTRLEQTNHPAPRFLENVATLTFPI